MGMERSEITAEGTIKAGLHKTPTTEYVPQLFDARRLRSGSAHIILHAMMGSGRRVGVEKACVLIIKPIVIIGLEGAKFQERGPCFWGVLH